MNKKINTLLFLLGATLFNILVTLLSFALLALLYIRFIMILIPEASRIWGFTIIFIAAIALSFLIYRLVLKVLLKKIQVEKYFDPILGTRKRNRRL